MKKLLLASVAALGLVGTASAADLAVAPVAYVPLFTWTGCYLGANGGWIGSDAEYTTHAVDNPAGEPQGFDAGTANGTHNSYSPGDSAGTFGGQFGCQAQLGSWVIGGEWDWNWSGLKEENFYTHPTWFEYPVNQFTHKQLDWFSTARARLGFAWDRVLIYATGGLAYASFDAYTQFDSLAPLTEIGPSFGPGVPEWVGSYHQNRFGYAVGGGLEWAFANNWTAKAEFLYLDFGSFDYRSTRVANECFDVACGTQKRTNGGQFWLTEVDAKEYVARIGINYLFHTGGAPVVARY